MDKTYKKLKKQFTVVSHDAGGAELLSSYVKRINELCGLVNKGYYIYDSNMGVWIGESLFNFGKEKLEYIYKGNKEVLGKKRNNNKR